MLDRQGEEGPRMQRMLLYSQAPPSMQLPRRVTRNLSFWDQPPHVRKGPSIQRIHSPQKL